MKNVLLLFCLVSLFGCRSAIVNMTFQNLGIYDDAIVLEKIVKGDREIIFFPMHHLGTELFYDDVRQKTDSLLDHNFLFYKELVTPRDHSDTILRFKMAKFTGIPPHKNGYAGILDSMIIVKNLKLKKELINQPKYEELNLNHLNSRYSDPSTEDIIAYYESNVEEIPINDCDLEKGLFNFFDSCPKYKANKRWRDKSIHNFRNNYVIDLIRKDTANRIAIFYGRAHIKPIKDSLFKLGYK